MNIFKPTLTKLALAALLIVALVPFIQLSQPECAEYAKLSHGDGAPTVCVEGTRTFLMYGLLVSKGPVNMDYYGSWNWKQNVAPNYLFFALGVVAAYAVSCTIMSTRIRSARSSRHNLSP